MKKIKQSHIAWIAPVVESLLVCLPFLGIINFIFIAITMYASIRPYIMGYAPWITIWAFMLMLVVFTLFAMFLVWKYVLSALWKYRGLQMFERQIMDKLEHLEKMIENAK